MHKISFPYRWNLSEGYPAKNIEHHKKKVFSCFASGGGSTMGYKLAGYDVIGANEFVDDYALCYKNNHNPKYLFVEDIRTFRKRQDLPSELFDLDILDGSPPCSAFSTAGKREEGWGIKKKYADGRKEQVVDDLFFEFIDFVKTLQPKIVVAENVKGLIMGNAKIYCKKIKDAFNDAGYEVQLFLLNAATMGVAQKRERVFFIARKKDLKLPELKLSFNEQSISIKKAISHLDITEAVGQKLTESTHKLWLKCRAGDSLGTVNNGNGFSRIKLDFAKPCNTLTTHSASDLLHPDFPTCISDKVVLAVSSFPLDYNFCGQKIAEITGRAVPPVMMAQLSYQIYLQLFKNR